MRSLPLLAGCLLIFHSPDGREIRIEADRIAAVRAVHEGIKEHLAAGTNALLYVDGQKFGVIETAEQADAMVKNGCDR